MDFNKNNMYSQEKYNLMIHINWQNMDITKLLIKSYTSIALEKDVRGGQGSK